MPDNFNHLFDAIFGAAAAYGQQGTTINYARLEQRRCANLLRDASAAGWLGRLHTPRMPDRPNLHLGWQVIFRLPNGELIYGPPARDQKAALLLAAELLPAHL